MSLVLIFGILVCRFVQIIWPTWAWWGHNLLLPRDILRSESDCFFLILPLNLGRKLHFTSENKENFLSLWPFHPLQNLIWYKTWYLGQKLDRVIKKGNMVIELYFEMENYGFASTFLCLFCYTNFWTSIKIL